VVPLVGGETAPLRPGTVPLRELAVAPAVTMDEASSLSWHLWSEGTPLRPGTVPLRGVSCRACCDHGRSVFSVEETMAQRRRGCSLSRVRVNG